MQIRCKIRLLALFLFSLLALQACADPTQEKLTKWMKRNGIPGAVVEIYDNGKRKSYYLGYADKSTKTLMTQDTIFEIASLTKIFTSILFADAVRSGSMALKDPVLRYVPDFSTSPRNKLNQITLENLATHTTGFPFNVPKSINSRKKLTTYLSKWKNPTTVGSSWLYSNVNMGLLGYSLEKQTQKNINELYAEKILRPLGMWSSNTMIPNNMMYRYAQGYNMAGTPAPRRNSEVWKNPPNSDWIFPASGALKSTGRDMSRFLKAALHEVGTPQTLLDAIKLTQTSFVQTSRFQQGLTWIIHPEPFKNKTKLVTATARGGPYPAKFSPIPPIFDGNALMEKTGASGGFRSYVAVIPNQKVGVVLLVNRYITSTELIRMGRSLALNN